MPSSPVPLDEDGFTAFVAERFREAVPDYPVTIDAPLTITIAAPSDPLTCNLDRAFDHCRSHPRDSAEWLESYVEKMRAYLAGMNAPIDRSMLRVVVRPKDYIERMQQGMAAKGIEAAVEPLAEDLSAVVYIDLPTALRSAGTHDFKALGLTPAEAMAEAKANQAADREDFEDSLDDFEDGIGMLTGDVYHSSWFALPEVWAGLAEDYQEGLLVAVPAMDTLIYARDLGIESLSHMHQAAEDLADKSERPISKSVYRWTEQGWELVPGPVRMGDTYVYLRPKPGS